MFHRKAYDKLLAWKAQQGRTSMLIEGARRVGKTTLARAFAKEYAASVYVNCETISAELKDLILNGRTNVSEFLKYFFLYNGVQPIERNTLVIFDEVQMLPQARSFTKHLVADGRYDYITTGSLVSIRENIKDILIPSEESRLALRPLDFDEWLRATNNDIRADLIMQMHDAQEGCPEAIHRLLMRLWREYLLVGGMPQVVQAYVDTNDFFVADQEKRMILDVYRSDIARFAHGQRGHVEAIFDSIPGELSKHEKKFTLSVLGRSARMRDYDDAFFWLTDAGITNMCLNATDPTVGLGMSLDHTKFKCYMADTGLLFTHAFADTEATQTKVYRDVLFDKLQVNEGMLVENAIAQQLASSGHRLLFFSRYGRNNSTSTMEIDFLMSAPYQNAALKQRVCPIEVKSSTRFFTKSLDKFKSSYGSRVGNQIVLSPRPYSREGDRIFMPLYMAHLV